LSYFALSGLGLVYFPVGWATPILVIYCPFRGVLTLFNTIDVESFYSIIYFE
jgi:hypothetical protein